MEYNQNNIEALEYKLNISNKKRDDDLVFALSILKEKNYSLADLGKVCFDGVIINDKKVSFLEINNLEKKLNDM